MNTIFGIQKGCWSERVPVSDAMEEMSRAAVIVLLSLEISRKNCLLRNSGVIFTSV